MDEIDDIPALAHLLQYQIRAAEQLSDELMRDAVLTLLGDVQRWQWLIEMNTRSIERGRQVLPENPPASIIVAA
jgi:hypothetical protein